MRSRGAVHDLRTTGRRFHQHLGPGVRLGRLEAGQEALKASLGDVRQDLKFLLRFAWGATAVIALLVVVVPVAFTLAKL